MGPSAWMNCLGTFCAACSTVARRRLGDPRSLFCSSRGLAVERQFERHKKSPRPESGGGLGFRTPRPCGRTMTGSLEALGNGFPVAFNATPPNRAVGCVLRRLEYIPCCETTYEPAALSCERYQMCVAHGARDPQNRRRRGPRAASATAAVARCRHGTPEPRFRLLPRMRALRS